jgi:hypothetical protein
VGRPETGVSSVGAYLEAAARVDLGEERLALSSSFLGSLEMFFFGGGLGMERFDLGSSFGPISWYLSFFLVAIFVLVRRCFDFRCSGLLIAVPFSAAYLRLFCFGENRSDYSLHFERFLAQKKVN